MTFVQSTTPPSRGNPTSSNTTTVHPPGVPSTPRAGCINSKDYGEFVTHISYSVAKRMGATNQDAEDFAGDVCCKALEHEKATGEQWSRAQLYKIVGNAHIDHWRKNHRIVTLSEEEWEVQSLYDSPITCADPAMLTQQAEEAAVIREAVAQLPPALQVVVEQHYFDELSGSEIAKLLNVPIGTVYRRLFDARELLRGSLGTKFAGLG